MPIDKLESVVLATIYCHLGPKLYHSCVFYFVLIGTPFESHIPLEHIQMEILLMGRFRRIRYTWKNSTILQDYCQVPALYIIEGKGDFFMKVKAYGQGLLVGALVTAALIFALSFGLYQFQWSDSTLQIGIWVVYALAALAGGMVVGKKLRNRRFVWGLAYGLLYFVVLFLISGATTGGWNGNF